MVHDSEAAVTGWVMDRNDPQRALAVCIYCDGQFVGYAPADRFRRDLKDRGVGTGRHGFSARLDAGSPAEGQLSVFVADSNFQLRRSPTTLRAGKVRRLAPLPTPRVPRVVERT